MTCRNQFLESDGYCTACGQNHFKIQRKRGETTWDHERKVARAEARKAAKQEEIAMAIEANPLYREAKKLIEKMAADYGIQVRVIFRNRQASCAEALKRSDGWTITLGYQSLNNSSERGFREYAGLEYLVPRPRPTGVEGGKWVAVHEFAHVLDFEINGTFQTSWHGPRFARIYKDLIKEYLQ